VPRSCQNERRTAVASGHSRIPRTASDLGMGWLTCCGKHTSNQPVTRSPVDPDVSTAPAGLTVRARPGARPEARAANLRERPHAVQSEACRNSRPSDI
jgi:hypothetical protein